MDTGVLHPERGALSGFFVTIGAALAVVATLLAAAAPARAETITLRSWVYPALRTFELRGLVSLRPEIPYSRVEIEGYVRTIQANLDRDKVTLGVRERYLLERLVKEFIGTGDRPEDRENKPVIVIREGSWFGAADGALGGAFRKRVDEKKGEADGLFFPDFLVGFGERLTLQTDYRVVLAPERGLNRNNNKPGPRVRSFRGLTAEYERSLLSADGERWHLQLGRDYVQWGSARREGLLLSRTAGSFDNAGARFSIGRLTMSTYQVLLDAAIPRRLAAHRLAVSLPHGAWAAIDESAVYARRSLDPVYLLPTSIYYANQYNERKDDNVLFSADWKVPLTRGLIFYGEFLADDVQYQVNSVAGPNKTGINLSLDGFALVAGRELEWTADYTRINIYTYSHKDSLLTRYVTGNGDSLVNPLIGSPLGPDADRWHLRVSYAFHKRAAFAVEGVAIRRGEGNDQREWHPGLDRDPPFPSGKVLKERAIAASQLVDFGAGSLLRAGIGVRSLRGGPNDIDRKDGFGWLELILDF
jgi:hypothetical protein